LEPIVIRNPKEDKYIVRLVIKTDKDIHNLNINNSYTSFIVLDDKNVIIMPVNQRCNPGSLYKAKQVIQNI